MFDFQKILNKTLGYEGVLSNDPADPGGKTYKGVTQRVYDSYRLAHNLQAQDVSLMSNDECQDLYRVRYFVGIHPENLADIRVAWKLFDCAVNMGVTRSVKFLQSAIGVTPDGMYGDQTKEAVINYFITNSPMGMIEQLVSEQVAFYRNIVANKPEMEKFLQGWLRRANDTGVGL